MRALRRTIGGLTGLALLVALSLVLWVNLRARPQDLPWPPLNLGQPIGAFTGRKLTALTRDFPACRAMLDQAGVSYTVLPPRRDGDRCGYADGVRLVEDPRTADGKVRRIAFSPAGLGLSCPVAAALALWEWNVVQPAAQRHFGAQVARIDHLGSYSCRRIAGSGATGWSEHSTADAVDIAGFRLSNGTRITIARDWRGDTAKAAFLHDVRDGACTLFATTLSPDYNAAHADHLHLDQAERGSIGWRACH
ncbi:extensin family protein [Sphingomonas sp. PP-CE-1G-424]|uniref:extensin-like domain-containing protein n=1 Tax=Sphingomonas sp. PP-CE-1G-424 TaxID=2135658 RepID=UPI001055CC11|nr:extensin family protein [Sphingomonas sp. PP-CE-1G-424]